MLDLDFVLDGDDSREGRGDLLRLLTVCCSERGPRQRYDAALHLAPDLLQFLELR